MSIRVEHLKYVYSSGLPNETVALDDISFGIEDGEFVGIIGHTGSGKSTLLQQLNGLLKPTEGSIYIDGECITSGSVNMSSIRKKVGLVFQYPEYQLFEETVAKDVAFGPGNLGMDDAETDRVVREAIEIVGLDYEKIKDRSPFELSGGQKRRVAIAGVIAMSPKVLILDEPTAGLDPEAHREILKMVERIHSEREMTLIFVSHNMADIAALSDRVLVIDKGRIILDGTPGEVFGHIDELRAVGLGVPPVTGIMRAVEERIPEVNGDQLTIDGSVEELAKLLEKKGKKSIR